MKINDQNQTAEQLLGMLLPDTKPDPLTAARLRLERAETALAECDPNESRIPQRLEWWEAASEVERLETLAMQSR